MHVKTVLQDSAHLANVIISHTFGSCGSPWNVIETMLSKWTAILRFQYFQWLNAINL